MRKLKIFIAACALLAGAGVQAQEVPVDGGVYYLFNTESGKLMTRGGNWGTKVVTNDFGSPWQVSIDANGKYTLRMYDIVTFGSQSGFGDNSFSDNGSPIAFTVAGDANGFTLMNGSNYITSPDNYGDNSLAPSGNKTWQFLNVEQYKAVLAEKTAAQEASIAATAGIALDGSSLSAVVGNENMWRRSDVSSAIPFPSNSSWTVVNVDNRAGNYNEGSYGVERYQGGGSYTYTATGLAKGVYKVGVRAMLRSTSNAVCTTIGDAGYVNSSAYFSANGNVVQIKDWYSSHMSADNPNNTGAFVSIANGGGYYSEVFTYVGDDGVLELKAVSESYWNYSWFLFNGVTLTYYSDTVSDEDVESLLSEAATLDGQIMEASVQSALASAKDALNSAHTIANYNLLSEAVEAAKASVTAYNKAKAYLDEAAELLEEVDKIQTFQFVDEQGNIIPDGSVITISEATVESIGLLMKVPLHVKNLTGEKVAVSMWEDINQKPSGEWQTCAFGNCMTLAQSGYSAKAVLSGEYDQDIITEWILEEGQYASWTAILEIRYFDITKNFFGMEQAGNNVVGYGPRVTVHFVYADDSDINNNQRTNSKVQRTNGLDNVRTNVYTIDAYANYYADPKAKYEARTLTTAEGNALVKTTTGWHIENTIDDILLSAWTIGGEQAKDYTKALYINTWSTEGNADGSNFLTPFYEYWTGDVNQLAATTIQAEVAGLKANQLYKIDAWSRLRATDGTSFATNGVTLQVGEGTAVDLTKATQIGASRLYADVFSAAGKADADGKLTIKFVIASNSGASWLSFKNVKYAELDDERIPLAEQLATAVATAQSLSTTLAIPSAMKEALFDVVFKYQGYTYTSLETVAEFNAAIAEVNGLIVAAKTIVDPYAAYLAQKEVLQSLPNQDTYNDPSNAKGAFEDALATADANVEAALTFAAIDTETTNILAAAKTFVKSVTVKAGEALDITVLVKNAHFTNGAYHRWNGIDEGFGGWTLEEGNVTELRPATHNFEAYHSPFNLSQTITDLPKGTYKVTLQGFARHDDNGPTDKTNLYCGIVNQPIKGIRDEYSTVSFFNADVPALGDNNYDQSYTLDGTTVYQPNGMTGAYYWFQQTNPLTGQPFYTNEVQTLIPLAGDLKIGFKCETSTDWVIWDNFHLYYYGTAIDVTMTEELGTSFSEEIEDANVTITKSIYDGWNTIVVPFAMNIAEIVNALPAEILNAAASSDADLTQFAIYTYAGLSGRVLDFEEVETAAIEANVPYLLYSPYNFGQLTFKLNNRHIEVGETITETGTGYEFAGVYQQIEVANGDYILGETDFLRSEGGNKVPAYRAYIKKTDVAIDEARLQISIDGVTTAINTVDGQSVNASDAIYNMAGQQVKKAQKGLYIQNGKKVVVRK